MAAAASMSLLEHEKSASQSLRRRQSQTLDGTDLEASSESDTESISPLRIHHRMDGIRWTSTRTITLLVLVLATFLTLMIPFTSLTTLNKSSLTHSTSPTTPLRTFPAAPTQHHVLTISKDTRRPNGVQKEVYTINAQFPGPAIVVQQGSELRITVHNALANESTALHWHGLSLPNEQDGTPGVTQSALLPGASQTYVFTPSQPGTFWYHAHAGVQRADGLYGGLVVLPSESSHTPPVAEDHLFLLSDWYHAPAREVVGGYLSAASFGNEPVPDAVLVNGRGQYPCSLAVPARPVDCEPTTPMEWQVTRGALVRMHLVNAGAMAGLRVLLANGTGTAIAVDGGNAVEHRAGSAFGVLHPGERLELLAQWDRDGQVCFEADDGGFRYENPALARRTCVVVRVSGPPQGVAEQEAVPTSVDLAELRGVEAAPPAQMTVLLYTTTLKLAKDGNVPTGVLNRTSWVPQEPALAALPRERWDARQLVVRVPAGGVVDIVLNNLDDGPHPFHLHGHTFWVMRVGGDDIGGNYWGSWNPYEEPEPPGGVLQLSNRVIKDTVVVPRRGHVVVRVRFSARGLWLWHCHLAWHLAGGMAMVFEVE